MFIFRGTSIFRPGQEDKRRRGGIVPTGHKQRYAAQGAVLSSSFSPSGRRSSRMASTLAGAPVASMVYDLGVTSMIFARKISTIRSTSARFPSSAVTLISAISRSMALSSVKSITLITSISLFSCLVICSSICSSPRVTMVIRDRVSSLVGATDRESILKPRPEKSPATRESTPNSFSTSTVIVCLMGGPPILYTISYYNVRFEMIPGRRRANAGSAQIWRCSRSGCKHHLRQRCPAGHHREDLLLAGNLELHDDGAWGLEALI